MSVLGGIKSKLGSNKQSITINDWKTTSHSHPSFDKNKVKACSTQPPRFVITDQTQKQHIVYTESLITCIGILIHGRGSRGDIAGLVHALAGGGAEETKRVLKVIEKINSNYGTPELAVTFVIGDEPDQDLFNNLVKQITNFDNISENHLKLIYAGEGEPGFKNGFTDPYEYSGKVAYDTKRHKMYVGADKRKK